MALINCDNKSPNSPKVSIIILNWNGLEDTIDCLESLKKITYPNYEVIVVDNGSREKDAQVLNDNFGDYIHLIRNQKNYGYTGGNNIGIRYASSTSSPDYFLIMNNDVVVTPDFLTPMIETAKNDQSIGILGPKLYYHNFPGIIYSTGIKTNIWLGSFSSIGHKQLDRGQYDVQQEVDSIAGSCLLVSKDVIHKIGLFDESFFSYCDEIDYCFRAQRAGFRNMYVPQAIAWHKKVLNKKIGGKLPYIEQGRPLDLYYGTRNNFKFMRKHGSKKQYVTFILHVFSWRLCFMTGILLLYHRNIRELVAFYRGLKDGLLNSETSAKIYTKE
jgi:GT2 family glycosyltransferase